MQRYYWDSCVFIALISNLEDEESIEKRNNCTAVLSQAMDGSVQILTSTVSLTEVITAEGFRKKKTPDKIKDKLRDLFREPYITLINCDLLRAEEARELIWNHKITALDAIHVASAVYAKVQAMHTYDGLSQKKRSGILSLDGKIGDPPLKIVTPNYGGMNPLIP